MNEENLSAKYFNKNIQYKKNLLSNQLLRDHFEVTKYQRGRESLTILLSKNAKSSKDLDCV